MMTDEEECALVLRQELRRKLSETHDNKDERPHGPLFCSKYQFWFSFHVFHASAKRLKKKRA